MVDESALVVVAPEDSVDALIRKVRGANARQVELLVPNGTVALQSLGGFERLVRATAARGVQLLVYSDDPQVLAAAQRGRIDTVSIEGAAVLAPLVATADATPAQAEDTKLLDALDSLASAQAKPQPADYDDAFAALDDLSDTFNQQAAAPQSPADRDADFAAAFDDWGDTAGGAATGTTQPLGGAAAPAPLPPRPRVRPEDIELSADDMRRQPGGKRDKQQATNDARAGGGVGVAGRFGRLALLVPLVLLLALLAGGWWLYRQRTTVVIAPPAQPVEKTVVNGLVIALGETAPSSGSSAVQARQLLHDAEATAQGQATNRTPAPVASAQGTVSVRNKVSQEFRIPAGSDVVGVNAEGQEVHFSVDQEVVVPASVTTVNTTAEGSSQTTTFGRAQFAITARAPGSASNLPAGAIRRIGDFGDSFSIESGAIAGGAEADTLVVGQQDVDALLGGAVTNLYNSGVAGLQQGMEPGWAIERSTISPTAELVSGGGYEQSVVPDIGTTVDPASPVFSLMLRARFSALATPSGRPLQDQIGPAVTSLLQTQGKLTPAAQTNITGWVWDGQELRASAEIVVSRDASGLPVGFVQQLQRDLVGKTSADARTLLDQYKAQGEIGDYTLPERDSLPNWSFLLNVAVAPQAGAKP